MLLLKLVVSLSFLLSGELSNAAGSVLLIGPSRERIKEIPTDVSLKAQAVLRSFITEHALQETVYSRNETVMLVFNEQNLQQFMGLLVLAHGQVSLFGDSIVFINNRKALDHFSDHLDRIGIAIQDGFGAKQSVAQAIGDRNLLSSFRAWQFRRQAKTGLSLLGDKIQIISTNPSQYLISMKH